MEPRSSLITLGVADLERATRFYEECLGLPRLKTPPSATFFELGRTWLALWSRESLAADAGVQVVGCTTAGEIGPGAGDDLRFDRTHVFSNGRFLPDSAVLILVRTLVPFRLFKTRHFVSVEEERLVVTASDPARRIVYEINGLPAAEEYARLIGVDARDLNQTLTGVALGAAPKPHGG